MLIDTLRCESQTGSPVTDVTNPRLSWSTTSTTRGDAQTAYQLQFGSTVGATDLWDTGKVSSAAQLVTYQGAALTARKQVFWQASVRDAAGNWSQPAQGMFEMGLLAQSDWAGALQIAHATVTTTAVGTNPSANVRKDFTAQDKMIVSAQLYVTAVGVYRPFINGVRVGAQELAPGWTNYVKRYNYQRYNVTSLVRRNAANAVGFQLGDGWGVGMLNRGSGQSPDIARNNYDTGGIPYVMAMLVIQYSDTTTDKIVTDATWKGIDAANRSNDIYFGGTTDNRLALNFTDPSVSAAGWAVVTNNMAYPTALVKAQPCAPIRRREILTPIAAPVAVAGGYMFDMGVNHSGFPIPVVAGATSGQSFNLQYGEKLNADGTLYNNNLSSQSLQTYTFIAQGLATETFEPLHAQSGGRYIFASSWPGTAPTAASLTSVRISADLRRAASFSSSSSLLNTIFTMAEKSVDANMMAVMTDCHQRAERLGWLFDLVASVSFISYLKDSSAYLQKYALDQGDAQSGGKWPDMVPIATNHFGFHYGAAGWHFGGYFIPWIVYQFTGDVSVLSSRISQLTAGLAAEPCSNPWNDYLPAGPTTDSNVFVYAFACRAAQLMVQIYTAVGDTTSAASAQTKLNGFLTTFRSYIAADGTINGDTQTAYVFATLWGLCPDAATNALCFGKLVSSLNTNGIQTGLPGTAFLLEALTLNGRADLALSLATNTTQLGWAQNATQTVAGNPGPLTTFPERWNGYLQTGAQNAGANSLCHHVRAGPIGEWLIRRVAGIDFEGSVGFTTVALRPFVLTLTNGSASIETPKGRISSSWAVTSKGFFWSFEVPPGCTATITMPVNRTPTENGVAVTFTQLSADPITGGARYQVGSGRYNLFA